MYTQLLFFRRVENVDLNAYFSYKAKKEQQNKPACPFANKWMNKGKLGPVKQTNSASFVVTERNGQGPETITLSSPKTKNVLSVHRLKDIQSALSKAEANTDVTSIFVTTTVSDTSNMFEINERIETNDTKVMSCGLAYTETAGLVSYINRQVSIDHLSATYYDTIHSVLARKDPKLIVTFSNGRIPLNAAYLTLCLGFMRVITEHSLLVFTLDLSHAPIPPLLLLASACGRARTTKLLPAGLDLYLALAAPDYAKLRGPELVYLGLADAFVPETKLADAFDTAKNMAICTAPDTNAAIQLALAIHHTYSGPNRLTVWEKYIESVFGVSYNK